MQRILSRLEVKVKNARVRIKSDNGPHGGIFELAIGDGRYADETNDGGEEDPRQTVRTITLSSVGVYMTPLPNSTSSRPSRFFTSASRSSSMSTAASTLVSGSDDQAEMYLSQAVADLRQSRMSSVQSEASIYQSALSEHVNQDDEASLIVTSRMKGRSRSRAASETGPTQQGKVLLLSFGSEDIVFRLKSILPHPRSSVSLDTEIGNDSSQLSSRPAPRRSSTSFVAPQQPAIDVDLSIGTIAILILPSQAAIIFGALQIPVGRNTSPQTGKAFPSDLPVARVDAKVRLKAVHLVLIYDVQAHEDPSFASGIARYWSKPATPIHFGHLNLRLESLVGNYFSQGYVPTRTRGEKVGLARSGHHRSSSSVRSGPRSPTITLELADAAVFEILASNTPSPPADLDDRPPSGAFPVMIFDGNLPKQYELGPGAEAVHSLAATHAVVSTSTYPDFDCIDWRTAGPHQRSTGSDKSWRVRAKGRGVLKKTLNSVFENEGPVLAARKDLSRSAGRIQSYARDFLLTDTSSCCGGSSAAARFPRSLLSRAPFTHAPIDRSRHSVCWVRPDPGVRPPFQSGSNIL